MLQEHPERSGSLAGGQGRCQQGVADDMDLLGGCTTV